MGRFALSRDRRQKKWSHKIFETTFIGPKFRRDSSLCRQIQNQPKGRVKIQQKNSPKGGGIALGPPQPTLSNDGAIPTTAHGRLTEPCLGHPRVGHEGAIHYCKPIHMITCAKIKHIKHISGPVTVPVDTRQCRVCVKTATYCTYCASQIMRIKLIACETDTEEWKGRKVLVKS